MSFFSTPWHPRDDVYPIFRRHTACRFEHVAKRFEDLDCWQLSIDLQRALLSICSRPDIRKDFDFVDQLRAAARSAPSNIAEGFGRRTHRDFAHFLDIARGSLMECQSLIRDAVHCAYISGAEHDSLRAMAARAIGATTALQRYLRAHPDR
jgi:four helix bundle protein